MKMSPEIKFWNHKVKFAALTSEPLKTVITGSEVAPLETLREKNIPALLQKRGWSLVCFREWPDGPATQMHWPQLKVYCPPKQWSVACVRVCVDVCAQARCVPSPLRLCRPLTGAVFL